ncbi:MAG: hypothetical protein M3Q03_05680 [Chloroflexota bacterium]|nr:hypothetical protein [Chloroflexota bacterium]
MDNHDLLYGVPVVALVPAVVEGAKRAGLPPRYAGLAAIGIAAVLVALGDLAQGESVAGAVARWLVAGVVYGLAGSGLYTQVRLLPSGSATGAATSRPTTEPLDR